MDDSLIQRAAYLGAVRCIFDTMTQLVLTNMAQLICKPDWLLAVHENTEPILCKADWLLHSLPVCKAEAAADQ